ncbi:hypothetical protein M3Y97_00781400 [Aphelenchoides bicaudatus]|nr:hypothetical protein M3Y97_00781400 [Aphelenchoides bicaudatus]
MKVLLLILLFFVVDCAKINFRFFNDYMYQTSVTVGKTGKKLNVLLDFTSTQLWFFATNSNKTSSPFLQLSSLPKVNISKEASILQYLSVNGLYDYDFAVKAYRAGNFSLAFDGNTTINSSTFGIVYADNYSMPAAQESVLGVGIIGIGSLLSSNLSNYLSGLLNNSGQFSLCTKPSSSQATLAINEPYFNKTILDKAIMTNYSKTPKYLGSFEFNITAVRIGFGFYLQQKISAIISTMTNFLTVDRKTWHYIRTYYRPAYDNKTGDYFIPCYLRKDIRINFSVQSNNATKWLVLPSVDLVEVTKKGFCSLKVRPSDNNFWVLGGPFLRHHCVQVEFGKQQLTFVNNTILNPPKSKRS